jgi:hypothetical protein
MSRRNRFYQKKESENTQRRSQFSKGLAVLIVFSSIMIVAFTLLANFTLLLLDKQPMANETISVVTTFGGITATAGAAVYSALAYIRDLSLNKHGLRVPEGGGKHYMSHSLHEDHCMHEDKGDINFQWN